MIISCAFAVLLFTITIWKRLYNHEVIYLLQPVSLGMNRSDYMFHHHGMSSEELVQTNDKAKVKDISIRQIEFNTMASSFGGLSTQITEYHRQVVQHFNRCSITKSTDIKVCYFRGWKVVK